MADKMKEYNRGRDQGLDMAWRMLRDAGNKEGAELIAEEIRMRGRTPIKLAVSSKEISEAMAPMKWCMYETFQCMALMVLHDEFGFGKIRCQKFLARWNLKTDAMSAGLVDWADYIKAVWEEIGIDLPTECMKEEGLIK